MKGYLLLTVVSYVTQAFADCTTVTPLGSRGFHPKQFSQQFQRVSSGLECNSTSLYRGILPCSSSQCHFLGEGTYNAVGTNNISLGNSDIASLYSLISNHSNIPFYQYASSNKVTDQICIDDGKVGYLIFEPWGICLTSVLSGCTSGLVADGTVAEICAPTYNERGLVNGTLRFIGLNADSPPAIYNQNPATTALPVTTATTAPSLVATGQVTPSYTPPSAADRLSTGMKEMVVLLMVGCIVMF